MSMQDNDMDALFRSKLDSYEVEPSSKVWANISEEIGAPKQRKSIIPMLRIAASVGIFITVGVYFWPKQQSVTKGDKPKQFASAVKPSVNNQQVNTSQTVNATQPVNVATRVQSVVNTQPKQVYAVVQHHQTVNQNPVASVTTQQPPVGTTIVDPNITTQPTQAIAAVTVPQTANPTVAAPIASATGTVVVPDDISLNAPQDLVKQPVVNASIATAAKKNKIHGLGGLLNAAISLVDRREDKIIEFTNNEDGDTITGINLGIVAIKKNNK